MKRKNAARSPEPHVAAVGALVGDPARATMLCTLLGGQELSATELARRGGVAANAASAHLAKLVAGGLLTVRASGRQRLFRLADERVARAIEALCVIAAPPKIVALSQARISDELRHARTCYDHLAGRLGVAVTDALVKRKAIVGAKDGQYRLTASGAAFCEALGIDVKRMRRARRHFASECIDWSERRPHLAGAAGAALCDVFVARLWVERRPGTRALRVTAAGRSWLRSRLSIDLSGDG